jgi:transposase
MRIVLERLRSEKSVSELCRREGIATKRYDRWSKTSRSGQEAVRR